MGSAGVERHLNLGGWEAVDGGGWVRRRRAGRPARGALHGRLARALLAARWHFNTCMNTKTKGAPRGGGVSRRDDATSGTRGKQTVGSTRGLRRAAVSAWRAWGLTTAGGARRAVVETVAAAVAAAEARDDRHVAFETFARALREVAERHVARARLVTAGMIQSQGDARGALRAYRAALGLSRSASSVSARDGTPRKHLSSWWAPADALLRAARVTKQLARSSTDMNTAEELLRAAIAAAANAQTAPRGATDDARAATSASDDDVCAETANDGERCRPAAETGRAAASDLAMLLCQQGRDAEASEVLTSMGFRYRLSRDVLRYAVKNERNDDGDAGSTSGGSAVAEWEDATENVPRDEEERRALVEEAIAAHAAVVRAYDGAMPERMLRHLRSVFGATSTFWSEHGYHRDGCGFFSYVHSLPRDGATTEAAPGSLPDRASGHAVRSTMDEVVRRVWRIAVAAFPEAGEATQAEWWAHCRPHASGHQMHFDSDDEGLGGVIRHPICTAVVYVTGDMGGPTLVTNQTDCSKQLATRGWLVGPKEGRVAVFNGDMLHGVIPGRGVCPSLPSTSAAAAAGLSSAPGDARRITLMVAFWTSVKVRRGDGEGGWFPKGSARPFPNPSTFAADPECPVGITWPGLFHPRALPSAMGRRGRESERSSGCAGGGFSAGDDVEMEGVREAAALEVGAVWEDVDEKTNASCFPSLAIARIRSLPPYNVCFQGF